MITAISALSFPVRNHLVIYRKPSVSLPMRYMAAAHTKKCYYALCNKSAVFYVILQS